MKKKKIITSKKSRFRYVFGWKKKLKALIPRHLKYTFISDVIEWLISRTHLLDGGDEPPKFIEFGGGGYVSVGNQLAELMVVRAGLVDGMTVVDIGSGIGRNAVAFSKRFQNISYLGFDVVRFGIKWCQKRFSNNPNFKFQHADIFNSFYNPRGSEKAVTYQFPLPNESTDFILATSVFTHMPCPEVFHYLQESRRCMRSGGTAYFTCFILDTESRKQIEAGATLFKFGYSLQGSFIESPEEPDLAVAYERNAFETMIAKAQLEVITFYPGYWRGLANKDFQDVYVLKKP